MILTVTYKGEPKPEIDAAVREAVGGWDDGSGYCAGEGPDDPGERDMEFTIRPRSLEAIKRRLTEASGRIGFEVTVQTD